jgi:hypothetical protein
LPALALTFCVVLVEMAAELKATALEVVGIWTIALVVPTVACEIAMGSGCEVFVCACMTARALRITSRTAKK